MSERVTVADGIFEQLGFKLVLTPDGQPRDVPAGQRPEPNEEVLVHDGEPCFQVRLETVVRTDDDVPDEVGLALRQIAERLYEVSPDGREVPGEQGPVEWIVGPAVHDGGLVMFLDTDGFGFSPAMIDSMVRIFVEELAPLGVQADISASPAFADKLGPAWMSNDERRSE